jgi:hypothetical protein
VQIIHILPYAELVHVADDTTDTKRSAAPVHTRTEAGSVFRCTTPEEFEEWARLGYGTIGSGVRSIRDSFCMDCLPAYRARMVQEGACWREDKATLIVHDDAYQTG